MKKRNLMLTLFLPLLLTAFSQNLPSFFVASQDGTDQTFDPSKITPIYSNVEIVGLELHSTWVGVSFSGFQEQVVFAAISSPWKPLTVTSNNAPQPFTELEYNPLNMTVNPIIETPFENAWDYDNTNEIVSLKLRLTSNDTIATVKVAIYYTVSVDIIGFSSSKASYTMYESIDVNASVSAQYLVENATTWLLEVLITQNSTQRLFQKASEQITLNSGETRHLHYNFRQITEAGTYVAIAEVYDLINENVVAYSQFAFYVSGPSTPQGETAIPAWMIAAFLSVFVIAVFLSLYSRFKGRILNVIKRIPKP